MRRGGQVNGEEQAADRRLCEGPSGSDARPRLGSAPASGGAFARIGSLLASSSWVQIPTAAPGLAPRACRPRCGRPVFCGNWLRRPLPAHGRHVPGSRRAGRSGRSCTTRRLPGWRPSSRPWRSLSRPRASSWPSSGAAPGEAFDLLRRVSQRTNIKVHVLAAQIVEQTASSGSSDNVTPITLGAARSPRPGEARMRAPAG